MTRLNRPISWEPGSSISFSSSSTLLCWRPIPNSRAWKKELIVLYTCLNTHQRWKFGQLKLNNLYFLYLNHTKQTYTLGNRKCDVSQLFEEIHACNNWDHVHDEVIVHHVSWIHFQTFQVVWSECGCQLYTGECWRYTDTWKVILKPTEHTYNIYFIEVQMWACTCWAVILSVLVLQYVEGQGWAKFAELEG